LKKEPNETELFCEFNSDSVLQVRGADDPDSLRGIGYKGVILDEYAMMKPEIWTEIIQPVLRANDGWAWFLFTPHGRNHAYHQWINGKKWDGWQNFFLDANTSGIISPKELEEAKKQMPEDLFKQEFLCKFLEGASSVFKGVSNCISGTLCDPIPSHRYVMGVDLARTVDFTVIIVIDQNTNRVVHFRRFNEISWAYQKEEIAKTATRYNDALIICDASGVGDPIVEDLTRRNLKVEGFKFTNISKQELVERAILAISQRMIFFPPITELLEELEAFTYEISASGNYKYQAPSGTHDDCVMAFCLALHGLHGNLYTSDLVPDESIKELYNRYKKPAFSFK